MLSMYINRLGLFRCLFNCIAIWQGSWAGTTDLCIEVGWCYTISVLVWCGTNRFPGCECAVKVSFTPLGHLNAVYMGIYSYMQSYI